MMDNLSLNAGCCCSLLLGSLFNDTSGQIPFLRQLCWSISAPSQGVRSCDSCQFQVKVVCERTSSW